MIKVNIKKTDGGNKNVVPKSYNEYKYALLNKKCLKHFLNRFLSKNHKIGMYEINKMYLLCFNNKMYIPNNGYDGLARGYQSWL